MQAAAAAGLVGAQERGFFEVQLREYEERRKVLIDAFERLGMGYTLPEGGYFVLLVSHISVEGNILFMDGLNRVGHIESALARGLPLPGDTRRARARLQVSLRASALRSSR